MQQRSPRTSLMLSALGYTSEWLDCGVLSESLLCEQHAQFTSRDGDRCAEHYRVGAFASFLSSRFSMDDDEIDRLLELRDSDGIDLRGDRIIRLVSSRVLNDRQLDAVSARADSAEVVVRTRIRREQIVRKVAYEGLSDDVFACIKGSNDRELHREAVADPRVSNEQLHWLAENGLSRSIRNQAMSALSRTRRMRG